MSEILSENKCRVRFVPENIAIDVAPGTNLLTAAMTAGVHITASCGGLGVCGTCKVKIESGTVESTRTEKITAEEFDQGLRQACRSKVLADLVVTIPVQSRLDKAIQAQERHKSAGAAATGWRFSPLLSKYYVELTPPTLEDNASDLFRLMRGLKQSYHLNDLPFDFEIIRKLPGVLREKAWKVTVTTLMEPAKPRTREKNTPRIINVEAGDTRLNLYALAIDVGTTTVCAQLLDLRRGKILADDIVFNRQISYGADVITRIAHCQQPEGLVRLQEKVVASINEVIDHLLARGRVDRKDIGHITVAGNTTMTQILLGLDPKYIRLAPYTPTANFLPLVKASPLGIGVDDHVYLYALPSVSSYVGGDIVSGVVSAGVHQRKKLTFYMDIGTNGEIVIGNSDWMVTASCSAGPAFEGGGIKHGMVAMSGAIQDFSLDPVTLEPAIKTINNAPPKGICGSGLINTVAALLEARVIGQNGKYNANLPSNRIREGTDGYEYVLARAAETETGKDIVITEVDIDNLIRAKAAMYAGCHTLSRRVNIDCSQFEQVIIAGNFGNSLDIEKAITIGLLPDIPRDRFIFIGNGSLSGARLVNFSADMLNAARKVAGMMTNIELSENNDFSHDYVAALFLPHTDERAFPTVATRIKQNDQDSCCRR
jgi:uncharacterized 2Fe-2S/4Fe-4S cluster protein (DUF4445 family)